MLLPGIEFYYEIESDLDETGDFPLMCTALLFDLLGIKSNILFRNQYAQSSDNPVLRRYAEKEKNIYIEYSASQYFLWIREAFPTNLDMFEVLKLQGMQLSCFVPISESRVPPIELLRTTETRDLFLNGDFAFACDITDEDRNLTLWFNPEIFKEDDIHSTLSQWEQRIVQYYHPVAMKRKALSKQFIQLSFNRSEKSNKYLSFLRRKHILNGGESHDL